MQEAQTFLVLEFRRNMEMCPGRSENAGRGVSLSEVQIENSHLECPVSVCTSHPITTNNHFKPQQNPFSRNSPVLEG